MFFRHTTWGIRWLQHGLASLEEEIQRQVHEDGVNYEQSTSYHRFVAEVLVTTLRLCALNGRAVSSAATRRVEKMFEFMQAYTRPDGTAPNIGDADDGRFFRFRMNDRVNDHRSTLLVGALQFDRPDFAATAGEFFDDALWLFGGEGFERFLRLRRMKSAELPRRSVAFPHGGFYVIQSADVHLTVDAGALGTGGVGGHGHNDTFSFELWVEGEPLIVDSGTYAYTFDVKARQEFRSTRAHNTVMVDGTELAEFAGLWRIKEDRTEPKVLQWQLGDDVDLLSAEHHAYRPIVHRREFRLDKRERQLAIRDEIMGEGEHTVESFLHIAHGFRLEQENPRRVRVIGERGNYYVVEISNGSVEVIDTWFSRSYGVKQPNQSIRISLKQFLPVTITMTISPSR
jgi:hypothetical protein